MRCECDNCGWTGTEEDVEHDIPRLRMRVSHGQPMPVGECKCGGLVYEAVGYEEAIIRGREECNWSDSSIRLLLEQFIHEQGLATKAGEHLIKQVEFESKCRHDGEVSWVGAKVKTNDAGAYVIRCVCEPCGASGTVHFDNGDIEWKEEE